jgi:CMP-N-acetylneuraminic acid synthetase
MEVLAIVPARGGSKGIAGKNLRTVGGVPLVTRAIRAARGARLVTRIAVSTDDEGIAEAARAAGAEVIDRPANLAGDEASSESALLHALDALREREGYEPELLVFVQCTSPFVTSADLDGAIEALRSSGADSLLAAAPFHGFVWKRGPDGAAEGVDHDSRRRPRRQDRESRWLETGAVYVMRTAGFRAAKHRFFGRTVLHEMPAARALDIDEPADLAIADAIADLVRQSREG